MQYQEQKVSLNPRWNLLSHLTHKEWWYTGISDEKQKLYIGISVIRTKCIDSIDISVYFADKAPKGKDSGGHWEHAVFLGYLKCGSDKNKLDVSVNADKKNPGFSFIYNDKKGDEKDSEACDNKWNLSFHSSKKGCTMDGSFVIKQSIPRFIKQDNYFARTYFLLHYFQNVVDGTLTINGKQYTISKGAGYQDHCYGNVPRKSKWHWIAVQGEKCALASLMNYGPYSQCYTEAFFGKKPNKQGWVRLNQNVSFECYSDKHFDSEWKITSSDMELTCQILAFNNQNNIIPPVVNLKHYQCYVLVQGKVRVGGIWKQTGKMYGVLEEHYGTW